MPDLGKYADTVLSAYAVSLFALCALVVMSVLQNRAAKKRLAEFEARFEARAAQARQGAVTQQQNSPPASHQ